MPREFDSSTLGFLAGGGTTGALIRATDWASTPLGPPQNWPSSLRTSIGTCLNCTFPILLWWGPQLIMLYNDAYAEIIADKHPAALGAPGASVWPEIWDIIGPMLTRVMADGEATPATDFRLVLNRRGFPEECYFSFSYSPIRNEAGCVVGVFCPVIETTLRVLGERRLAFRLDLERRLRDIEHSDAAKSLVGGMLAAHLGVASVGYAEAGSEDGQVLVETDWTDGRILSVAGVHQLTHYGPAVLQDLQQGLPVTIDDVLSDPRTANTAVQASYAALSVRALALIPLVKAGRMVAMLFALDVQPRLWSETDAGLLSDIAERTWAFVERMRAAEEFRALGENLPNLCWMAKADGAIIWYNRRWFDYTGTTPADMEGWGWQSVHHPDTLPAVMERWTQCLATGEPFEMTFPLRGADGVFRPFLTRIVPLRNGRGDITRWFGTNVDISAQQRTEAALRASEASLRGVADALPGFLWTAGPDGRLDYASQAWFDYAGTTLEQTLSWGWAEFIHPDDVPALKLAWTTALAQGVPYSQEFRMRRHDGHYLWFLGRATPVRDDTGGLTRWIGMNVGIEEQRQTRAALESLNAELEARVRAEVASREHAQVQLAHAQRMEALGQLAGGIAHDFNNVLQAVSSGLNLIGRRAEDSAMVRQLVGMVAETTTRGAAVTRRLLAFARKGELLSAAVEPGPLLASLHEMLRHTLGNAIVMHVDVAPNTPPLQVDRAQLETVLVNLAVNARDAMPGGGTLRVSATSETVDPGRTHPSGLAAGAYVRLCLSDTGHGMDAATLGRASEPFFTTKPVGQGTGLGLAMARGFAQQSGGAMTIESQTGDDKAGPGTRVTLWFPQAATAVPDAEPSLHDVALPPGATPPRVLVVDDDHVVREMLSALLEGFGYQIIAVPDAATALARLDEGDRADLLVTDLSMPGMNGLTLIEEARRRQPDLPAVLLTGYVDPNLLQAAERQKERLMVLRKPISAEELAAHAAALLRRKLP